jgi:hypothetical protein
MADEYKTCPFCLEEIPARAIKCKHCESVLEVVETITVRGSMAGGTAPRAKGRRKPVTQQGIPGLPAYGQTRPRRNLVPLIIILVALLIAGLGAGYWFLMRDTGVPVAGDDLESAVVGSWRGGGEDGVVYFQFLPNEMVNVAVKEEDYWFRTQYRIVKSDMASYLEIYHRGLAEWERTAELTLADADTLVMTDTWDGIVIELKKITDTEFRDQITDLTFER